MNVSKSIGGRRVPTWFPPDLIKLPQFVVWRFVNDFKSKKPRKVPVDPITLQAASSTDASNWSSFGSAVVALQQHEELAGVGFVFTSGDPYCGVDLDNCFDPTGALKPWAKPILEMLSPTYAEISPSLMGAKLIVRARKPAFAGCKKSGVDAEGGGIEIYEQKRFFTLTGNIYGPSQSPGIADRQMEIAKLCRMLWPSRTDAPPAGQKPAALENVSNYEMQLREKRCMHYLLHLPRSIEGQDGSGACLRAACETQRFGLNHESAWQCLCWYNETSCTPRWSWAELRHKLESAVEKVAEDDQFGSRLTQQRLVKPTETAAVISITNVKNTAAVVQINILK